MGHFRKLLVTLAVCFLILPSSACKHGDPDDDADKQTKKIKVKDKKAKDKKAKDKNKKLKEKGYDASLVKHSSENSVWYKVKIGNIDNIEEANSVLRALKKDGFKPIIVRRAKQKG